MTQQEMYNNLIGGGLLNHDPYYQMYYQMCGIGQFQDSSLIVEHKKLQVGRKNMKYISDYSGKAYDYIIIELLECGAFNKIIDEIITELKNNEYELYVTEIDEYNEAHDIDCYQKYIRTYHIVTSKYQFELPKEQEAFDEHMKRFNMSFQEYKLTDDYKLNCSNHKEKIAFKDFECKIPENYFKDNLSELKMGIFKLCNRKSGDSGRT